MKLRRLIFGETQFDASEEYLEFQYKFLLILMSSGAILTLLLVLGSYSGANRISGQHMVSMQFFTALAFSLFLLLRGHKNRFRHIAWAYEILCLLEYVSALLFVPEDELRIIWFHVNVPGIYILLGQRPGDWITAGSVVGLALLNPHLSAPLSPNAVATSLLALAYLGVIFHLYGQRSISYFLQLQTSRQELIDLAARDMLTGILNARAYYEQCDKHIRIAQRADLPFAVLFVDLDHFKAINDTYGHAAGDLVLKSVAHCLSESIRSSDSLGRIGGEEFSIFLPNTQLEGALQVAEAIRIRIESLMPLVSGNPLKVTASIGVATSKHEVKAIYEIQQQADKAMYLAKAQGRNRVSAFA